MKKGKVICLFLAVVLLVIAAFPVLAADATSIRVGPVRVVEPITPTLDPASSLPTPNSKMEPGDSFTVRVNVSNSSTRHSYWVSLPGLAWGGEGTKNVQLEISYWNLKTNNTIYGPFLLLPSTSTTVEMKVKIKEDSPPDPAVTFDILLPQRIPAPEMPGKG